VRRGPASTTAMSHPSPGGRSQFSAGYRTFHRRDRRVAEQSGADKILAHKCRFRGPAREDPLRPGRPCSVDHTARRARTTTPTSTTRAPADAGLKLTKGPPLQPETATQGLVHGSRTLTDEVPPPRGDFARWGTDDGHHGKGRQRRFRARPGGAHGDENHDHRPQRGHGRLSPQQFAS